MSHMGDRVYTPQGQRKYIGLHNELLDRPWTAKKRRGSVTDRAVEDFRVAEVTGITPDRITPLNPSLLGDVDVMARMFRQVCGRQESIARFTEDSLLPDDSELKFAKKQVQAAKEEVANILSSCLLSLSKVTETTYQWADKVVELTLNRDNWWEGYNILSAGTSRELQDDLIERALKTSPPKDAAQYSQYLVRCLKSALVGSRLSTTRKCAFVRRAYIELWRLTRMAHGSRHAWTYCTMLCLEVFLAHPQHIPLTAKDLFRGDDVASILAEIVGDLKSSSTQVLSDGEKVITQVNLAAFARDLRGAMDDYPCVQDDCGHKSLHDVYNTILQEARREVRHRVYFALGDRLPAELTEMIVEAAVVAEQVDKILLSTALDFEGNNNLSCTNWENDDDDEAERFGLNCEKSRWNADSNREWDMGSVLSAHDGDSDADYGSDDPMPRTRPIPPWDVYTDLSTDLSAGEAQDLIDDNERHLAEEGLADTGDQNRTDGNEVDEE
ncbi:hypothetical protein CC86DRAFT_388547 [Ophiobolus disseminans]|uniref:Uncharacterized protein n=1 Tax=Ophiobolus disseminans TaxID=1469910 RepID=A0A6A6ZCU1_9PLEO|nr:hypothetical protein CC86DRAFT_388547 [Ophiobolus disseminans]